MGKERLQAFLDKYWDFNQIYNQTDLASVKRSTAEAELRTVRSQVEDFYQALKKGKETGDSLAEKESTCRSRITDLEQALQAEKEKLKRIQSSQADLWRQVESDKAKPDAQRTVLTNAKSSVAILQKQPIQQVTVKNNMTAAHKALQSLFNIPSFSPQS